MRIGRPAFVLIAAAAALLAAYLAYDRWSGREATARDMLSISDQVAELLSKPVATDSKQTAGRLMGELNAVIGRLSPQTQTHCLALGQAVRASLKAYLDSTAGAQITMRSDTSLSECRNRAASAT